MCPCPCARVPATRPQMLLIKGHSSEDSFRDRDQAYCFTYRRRSWTRKETVGIHNLGGLVKTFLFSKSTFVPIWKQPTFVSMCAVQSSLFCCNNTHIHPLQPLLSTSSDCVPVQVRTRARVRMCTCVCEVVYAYVTLIFPSPLPSKIGDTYMMRDLIEEVGRCAVYVWSHSYHPPT